MDEGEVVARQSVEPGGEAAEVLELVEASLDAIAQLVDQWIFRDRVEGMTASAPIPARWARRLLAS